MSEQLDGFTEAWLINSVAEIFTPEHIADYSLEATRMFIRRLEDHLADLREHEASFATAKRRRRRGDGLTAMSFSRDDE